MRLTRPDLAAYALVALALVGIVVLAALQLPVPDVLTYLATAALGVGGGVAVQTTQAPAADPTPAPVAAPAPLTAEPATGVMRIASHAP